MICLLPDFQGVSSALALRYMSLVLVSALKAAVALSLLIFYEFLAPGLIQSLVGLLPGVDSQMLPKLGVTPEGFATFFTLIGFLTRVDSLVLD